MSTLRSAKENLAHDLATFHPAGPADLVDLCGRALPYIGEIQVADVPGRCEPGTGEIHYPRVARALDELGYTGVVAMEAFASADSDLALRRFREAFSIGV